MFSGVFIAEEVDRAGDMVSGDTTVIDVQTRLEASFNMPLRLCLFIDEAFSGKKQDFWSCDYCP